jgi:hypothetical protein
MQVFAIPKVGSWPCHSDPCPICAVLWSQHWAIDLLSMSTGTCIGHAMASIESSSDEALHSDGLYHDHQIHKEVVLG